MAINKLPDARDLDLLRTRMSTQFQIPSAYDDALSYQGLIYKLIQYLKDTMQNVEDWDVWLEDFVATFDTKLQDTVRDMIYELYDSGKLAELVAQVIDVVQDQIDAVDGKLDEMGNRLGSELSQIVTVNADSYIEVAQDVTRGLQRSIDEAISLNKARILWSGTYELTGPLVFERLNEYNNTQIVVFGGGQIKKSSTFNGDRLIQIKKGFHDEDNIVFENISFDGVDKTINGIDTFETSVPYNSDGSSPSDGSQSKFVSFKNCTFHRFYRAVRLSSLSYNFFSCLFQDNIYGAFLNIASNNNSFFSCQFRRNVVGAHIKQLNPSYGTMNNTFFNCIFESNQNSGLINEGANYTALFGGYFENNCHSVDSNYHEPPRKCDILFIGFGSSSRPVLHGVFFWSNATDVTIYGDHIIKGFIKSCGSITLDFSAIDGLEADIPIGNINVRSTTSNSNMTTNGVEYGAVKGEKYRVGEYSAGVRQIKYNKVTQSTLSPMTKLPFQSVKINTTSYAKLTVKMFLKGYTAGGNTSHEGYIERSFFVSHKTAPNTVDYYTTPIEPSKIGFAVSDSGAGAGIKMGNILQETSEIVLDKIDGVTQKINVTNLVNSPLTNWGSYNRIIADTIVEIEGVNASDYIPTKYTLDAIDLI